MAELVPIPSDAVATIYRMDGKLDAALARIERLEADRDEDRKRTASLERGRSWLHGAYVGFTTVLLGAYHVVTQYLTVRGG